MKHRILFIVMLVALALISVAPLAAQDAPEGFPLAIIDGAGRELTFDAPPQRVVTYYNDSYGMLATIRLMPVAQSVNPEMLTDPIYFDGQGAAIPTIPWSDAPDLEAVAAAQPDLVMVYSIEEAEALAGIAPAFVTYDPATLDELYEAVRQYGRLFAREDEAAAAVEAFQQRLAAYQALAPRDVTVLKLGAMDEAAFYISTVDDPICQILNTLARCEWQKATPDEFWGYETTIEGVLALDPDVIILNNWSSVSRDDMLAALADNPLWNELRAVQDERVIGTPGYENPIASNLPAATKFLDTCLPLLYPDIFPDGPLTDEQVQEILAGQNTGANAGTEGFPVTVVDGAGREVTFDAPPQRVMCFYTDCIEGMVGLGLKPAILPEWFLRFQNLTILGTPGGVSNVTLIPVADGTPNAEAIAAAEPELVMVSSLEEAQALTDVALTFVTYPVNSIDDVVENLRRYADVFGMQEEAEQAVERFLSRRTTYAQLATGDVRVMNVLIDTADPIGGDIYIRSTNSPDCVLLEELAQCPWTDTNPSDSWSFLTTIEYILQENPDVILIATYGGDPEAFREQLTSDPLWSELSAVQDDRLIIINDDLSADGVTIATRFLDHVAPAIYPDIFPAPLTDEQVQEILAEDEGQ